MLDVAHKVSRNFACLADAAVDDRSSLALRAYSKLFIGDYANGWQLFRDSYSLLCAGLDAWPGIAGAQGGHLLVTLPTADAAWGIGDVVFESRFFPYIVERDLRLTVEVPRKLVGLMQAQGWPVEFVAQGDPLPVADFVLEAHVLAAAIDARPEMTAHPYLKVARKLPPDGNKVATRVAVNWTARLTQAPLRDFERLFRSRPDIQWVSVERELSTDEAERLGVEHHPEAADDMAALAGVLAGCDSAVLVDSTAAHVSAALGIPTRVLLHPRPPLAAWRWTTGAWYPSATIVQLKPRWVDRVVAGLAQARSNGKTVP